MGDDVLAIAIVGGGPGGLVTAHYLDEVLTVPFRATVFEASSRVGGKVMTGDFANGSVRYEAGVAEIYDYSALGPDPLRELIEDFGLKTVPMAGSAVVLGDTVVPSLEEAGRVLGASTGAALDDFYTQARAQLPPSQYYSDDPDIDNAHPWATLSLRELLDGVPDDRARHYIETAIRSDTASEPHLTNALNGLKNVVMEDPRYMSVYSIVGGNERLIDKLAGAISADVELSTRVLSARQTPKRTWVLTTRHGDVTQERAFDIVIFALPNTWLSTISWGDRDLRVAMQRHLAHYDRPAHYLRVTALFSKPFWREHVEGTYFMHDAFGGCCLYDESARHPAKGPAALSWLICGGDALARANVDAYALIEEALASLPKAWGGRACFLEAQVYRWMATVNALPGGYPIHDLAQRHQPDAKGHPNLYVVGDYLFDSTLNGIVDSAEFVTDALAERLHEEAKDAADLSHRHLEVELQKIPA